MKNVKRKPLPTVLRLLVALTAAFALAGFPLTAHAATTNVSTETELKAAVSAAAAGDVINMTDDIQLTATLVIPNGTDVTITSDTGSRRLVGIHETSPRSTGTTIWVQGKLTIGTPGGQDGIVVTHNSGQNGIGIQVFDIGELVIECGSISGNRQPAFLGGMIQGYGAGVSIGGNPGGPNGLVTMNGGEIANNYASSYGGGLFTDGTFIFNGGEIHDNSIDVKTGYNDGGGGIDVGINGTFEMNGGEIYNNTAGKGGGVRVFGDAMISGGIIYDNTATFGGGIYVEDLLGHQIVVSDAEISDNTATDSGGGVYLKYEFGETFMTLDNIMLTGNRATGGNGGGVYVDRNLLTITGGTAVCNNHADNGSGGGVFTTAGSYGNLYISFDTNFLANTASVGYQPPTDADTLYPGIQYNNTSISTHPLNNYDINYVGVVVATDVYLFYDANGGTGSYTTSHSVGDTTTVLSAAATGISRPGYILVGWQSQGICGDVFALYDVGDSITVNSNTILYARWEEEPGTWDLVFSANLPAGANGSSVVLPADQLEISVDDASAVVGSPTGVPVSSDFTYTFTGWNTAADGGGVTYSATDTVPSQLEDTVVTLFAQWSAAPILKYTVIYNGNGATGGSAPVDASSPYVVGSSVTVLGQGSLVKTGYTFKGWATSANGAVVYLSGQSFTISANTELYAVWQQDQVVTPTPTPTDPSRPQTPSTPQTGDSGTMAITFASGLMALGVACLSLRQDSLRQRSSRRSNRRQTL